MLRLFQGEHGGNVFSRHRLKSVWDLSTISRVLDTAGQNASILDKAKWTRVIDGASVVIGNGINGWGGYRFSFSTENNI